MKRPPKDLGRRLLDVSEEVLRADSEVRLEDVAALVGSARATLYYYFSGRDDLVGFLLEEHLRDAADEMAAAIEDGESPADRLRLAVAALVAFLGRRPGVVAGILSFAGATGQLHTVQAAKEAMLVIPLRTILDEGASAGQFLVDNPMDAAHAMLGAAMVSVLGRWHLGDDLTAAPFQSALVDQIVRGVLPNG